MTYPVRWYPEANVTATSASPLPRTHVEGGLVVSVEDASGGTRIVSVAAMRQKIRIRVTRTGLLKVLDSGD